MTVSRYWLGIGIALATLTVAAPAVGQNTRRPTLLQEWEVLAATQVDLWYHGLAIIEFDDQEDFPLYNPEYVSRVWEAKQELGIYPTRLDSLADELRKEFSRDPAFQQFHFLPLYFPKATREQMMQSLKAIAKKRIKQEGVLNDETRRGIQIVSGTFQKGGQRKLLAKFVDALENEWDVFYRDYWQQNFASDSGYYARIQQRWTDEVAPAIEPFLTKQRLQGGRIFISPAVGPEGRLFQGNVFRRTESAVAVWWPQWDDLDASLFAAVREMCFAVVDDAIVTAGIRASEKASSNAAVRCGAMLLAQEDPEGFVEYRKSFLRAVGVEAEGPQLASAFEDAYEVDENLLEALRRHVEPAPSRTTARADRGGRVTGRTDIGRALGASPRRRPSNEEKPARTGWVVKAEPQTDLWFHSLAVIAADEPGPLGLYSADYAVKIREIKQARGVYPTMLDSLASTLRKQIAKADVQNLHFVPLWFPEVKPERLFEVLNAIADGNTRGAMFSRSDVRVGVFQVAQSMSKNRRLLRQLVTAIEDEWNVFYRDYWEKQRAERSTHIAEVQTMWDSVMVPQLGEFLKRRRLTAGLVMPSPGLGPEGRIVDIDNFDPADQVVSIQVPPTTTRADATVFAFLKELCFLIVNERVLGPRAGDLDLWDDLQKRAAVRCGALILQFYAPTLVPRYIRVFLDAVGAEESATRAAFERVYVLDPKVYQRIRQAIRGG